MLQAHVSQVDMPYIYCVQEDVIAGRPMVNSKTSKSVARMLYLYSPVHSVLRGSFCESYNPV